MGWQRRREVQGEKWIRLLHYSKTAQKTKAIQNEIIEPRLSVLFLSCSSMTRIKGLLGTLIWRRASCFGLRKSGRNQFFSSSHFLSLVFLVLTRGCQCGDTESRNRKHLKAIHRIMCLFPCEQAKRKGRKIDARVWFPALSKERINHH